MFILPQLKKLFLFFKRTLDTFSFFSSQPEALNERDKNQVGQRQAQGELCTHSKQVF